MNLYDDTTSLDEKKQLAQMARKSVWVSAIVNIVLSLTQIVVGFFSHSQGLIADGLHSLSDLIADSVALIATHYSRKEADDNHPYGHRRYENIASLSLGLILGITGCLMIANAVNKLINIDNIQTIHHSALYVALGTLLVKEGLFRYMLSVAKKAQSGILIANAWHARSDAASSLVVAIGIIGSLLAFSLFDIVAALLVGAMIALIGIKFAWNALQDLIDASADDETLANIKNIVAQQNGVLGFHDLRTRKTGDDVFVDIHVEVKRSLSVVEGHDIAVSVRNALLKLNNIADVMVHIDPADEEHK
ncbi:MAG: cation transporter [Neisseriaceae bacterium]|nr:cation transporter [Neisseriaceae bacterium]